MKEAFTSRALALLQCSNSDDFNLRANLIIRDFPPLKSWMEWWMRPAHASMLFESERQMDIKIWESIPKTTNAEEAMHWKLYSGCGRDHGFMEGMLSLYKVAEYYQRLLEGSLRELSVTTFNWSSNHNHSDILVFRGCTNTIWCPRALENQGSYSWSYKTIKSAKSGGEATKEERWASTRHYQGTFWSSK